MNSNPINVSFVGSPLSGTAALQNRSTWMINIGTHRKPFDDPEEELLKRSLKEALDRVLKDPEFMTKCLYPVEKKDGKLVKHTELFYRTKEQLKVTKQVAEVAIESGTKTGRLDAHVIYDVEHSDSKIQFDHIGFGELLDRELEVENEMFKFRRIYSSDPTKPKEFVRWANPSVYVSFNSLGISYVSQARIYLRKQVKHPQQIDALKTVGSNFFAALNTNQGFIKSEEVITTGHHVI